MRFSAMLSSALTTVLLLEVEASTYLSKLCRGHRCDNPDFPFIEYSEADNNCFCSAHPCWNDNGVTHACADGKFLFFSYDPTEDGGTKLKCACTDHSVFVLAQSMFIYRDKCPGQVCSEMTPTLDWSEE